MFEQFKKAIKLVQKTGDKIVFFDAQSPDDTVVIMNLDSYEKIALEQGIVKTDNLEPALAKNLTDEDLADKINREILLWKNQENGSDLEEENKPRAHWQIPPAVKNGAKDVV